MPATDDEIREKYLERAIRELNQLSRELQACEHCPRGQLMPVLGSGHPQADIFMFKYSARPSEVEEGVAFYGRTGNALMKSLKRLNIDPLAVYGTLCVKCPVADPVMADRPASRGRRGARDRRAEDARRDGRDALGVVNDLDLPLRRELRGRARRAPALHAVARGAVRARTSTSRSTRSPPSASSGRRSRCSASGGRTCRHIDAAAVPDAGDPGMDEILPGSGTG